IARDPEQRDRSVVNGARPTGKAWNPRRVTGLTRATVCMSSGEEGASPVGRRSGDYICVAAHPRAPHATLLPQAPRAARAADVGREQATGDPPPTREGPPRRQEPRRALEEHHPPPPHTPLGGPGRRRRR